LEFTDDRGRVFRVRLVGAVANSMLQGSLLVDEKAFVHRFPNEAGHRAFLVDAPAATAGTAAATLTRALEDVGFAAVPASERLARFNAVQNTYLNTFQALGALGLLLGSVGLGVVVLRNVHERRAELAVLGALGFQTAQVRRLVLAEHAVLVALGLGLGFAAAMVAVFPALAGGGLPLGGLALTLLGVSINGLAFAALATWRACRGGMLEALRGE
jgi:ABC-type antimicrobial peptide transport system permease subunit